jgi:alpha-tubulin suppressor-like RCC1 family protein
MRGKYFVSLLAAAALLGLGGCGPKSAPLTPSQTARPVLTSTALPSPMATPTETATDAASATPTRSRVPVTAMTMIATGAYHACAISSSGGVKCWGENTRGQLGDGTRTGRYMAVDVNGLSHGARALSAAGWHTCVLTAGGKVECWGLNDKGQLGDGTQTDSAVPVPVSSLPDGIQAVSAGTQHTCALTSGGGVKCWGDNSFGQLGDGTTTPSSSPVDVRGLTSGVAAVSAGMQHTCALTKAGGVKCWGLNTYLQLGDGTDFDRSVPVDVVGLSRGAKAVSAGGEFTCALLLDGGVKCWGFGLVGDGSKGDHGEPLDVIGLSGPASAISLGRSHACAVVAGGGVMCWGINSSGQLGDGSMMDRSLPAAVVNLSEEVTAVSASGVFTCALTASGGVKCWGDNGDGQLADGTNADSVVPVDVLEED